MKSYEVPVLGRKVSDLWYSRGLLTPGRLLVGECDLAALSAPAFRLLLSLNRLLSIVLATGEGQCFFLVLRIRTWIGRICMFLGLLDPDPNPLVRGMDPDPSIIKQK
jgi:hypothetical protein